jgi:hypothetical protein
MPIYTLSNSQCYLFMLTAIALVLTLILSRMDSVIVFSLPPVYHASKSTSNLYLPPVKILCH